MSTSGYYRIKNSFSFPRIMDVYPHSQFWHNNPLLDTTLIDARVAGYRPVSKNMNNNITDPYIDRSKYAVFQGPSDITVPVNKYYLENKTIVFQP